MFCSKCGLNINDDSNFCPNCGNTFFQNDVQIQRATTTSQTTADTPKKINNKVIFKYITIAIAIINIIMPFLNWIEVPTYNNLSSWFGGSNTVASYSLFSYITVTNNSTIGGAGISNGMQTFLVILLILAVVSMILNGIYLAKTFMKKNGNFKYGTIGSILLAIVALLFIAVIGLTSSVIKVISITSIPWIVLIFAIVNIVLIRKSKNKNVQPENKK